MKKNVNIFNNIFINNNNTEKLSFHNQNLRNVTCDKNHRYSHVLNIIIKQW